MDLGSSRQQFREKFGNRILDTFYYKVLEEISELFFLENKYTRIWNVY